MPRSILPTANTGLAPGTVRGFLLGARNQALVGSVRGQRPACWTVASAPLFMEPQQRLFREGSQLASGVPTDVATLGASGQGSLPVSRVPGLSFSVENMSSFSPCWFEPHTAGAFVRFLMSL